MLTSDGKLLNSGDLSESNNGNYAPCAECGQLFKPWSKKARFCSHACYSRSIIEPIEPRFWTYVSKTPTCWNWTGPVTGGSGVRHGQVSWKAKYRTPQKAHRVAWELANGPIPPDKQINHRCDNPICVNPEHLYLGTQADNMRDAAKRSRFTVPRTRTLSLFDRLTIYRATAYRGVVRDLAEQYGVSKGCISLIRSGRFVGSGVEAESILPLPLVEVERVIRMKEAR